MALEPKVLTTPTFINGSLQPAGAIVPVDFDQFVDEDGNKVSDEKAFPNLADVGEAPVLVHAEIAALGPTGPAPTKPQQIPAGAMQTGDGYASGEAMLIAQGHPAAAELAEGDAALNEGVEEEAVQRLSNTVQDAGTAGTNGTETGALDEGEAFTADTYVKDVTITSADFTGLSAEQLKAVHDAEAAGANRQGMLDKIDDAIRALG